MRLTLIPALAACSLTACAGGADPIAKQYFVLGLQDPAIAAPEYRDEKPITITRITLARYLNEQGIAMILDDNKINIANHALWGEELRNTIPRLLASDLEGACECPVSTMQNAGSSELVGSLIQLRIDRFGPTQQGTVILSGEIHLSKPDETRTQRPFHLEQDLTDDGYPAAVKTMRSLLPNLATLIAREHRLQSAN